MSEPAHSASRERKRLFLPRVLDAPLLGLILIVVIVGIGTGNGVSHIPKGAQSSALQKANTIGLVMSSYAQDHAGKYPDGKSSTAVFQKLLDEKYITDSTVFYLPLPGKIKPIPGEKLKPENVGFDVTSGLESNSPDELPIVFMTNYKVTYAPGSSPVFLGSNLPWHVERTWSDWWNHVPPNYSWTLQYGIAVAYKNKSASFREQQLTPDAGVSVPIFISLDYKPDGKTYRQLTPDGVLP